MKGWNLLPAASPAGVPVASPAEVPVASPAEVPVASLAGVPVASPAENDVPCISPGKKQRSWEYDYSSV